MLFFSVVFCLEEKPALDILHIQRHFNFSSRLSKSGRSRSVSGHSVFTNSTGGVMKSSNHDLIVSIIKF